MLRGNILENYKILPATHTSVKVEMTSSFSALHIDDRTKLLLLEEVCVIMSPKLYMLNMLK